MAFYFPVSLLLTFWMPYFEMVIESVYHPENEIFNFGPNSSSLDQIWMFAHNNKTTHTRYMHRHTRYACFPFNWLGQRSVKTLLTAPHKYFYQNGKAFPSHPEHAKIPLAFASFCRSLLLHYGPILPALPDELNRSDGCAASPEAPGHVREQALLQARLALHVSRHLGPYHLGCFGILQN